MSLTTFEELQVEQIEKMLISLNESERTLFYFIFSELSDLIPSSPTIELSRSIKLIRKYQLQKININSFINTKEKAS